MLLIPERPAADLLEVATAKGISRAMKQYGPRDLVSPTADFPLFVDRAQALYASWYEFFPRSQGATYDAGHEEVDLGHLRHLPRPAGGGGGDGLRRRLPAADPPDRHRVPQGHATTPSIPAARRPGLAVGDRLPRRRP